ncbi:hypothetical protein D3C86_1880700 [compost metagenome]
MPPRPPGLAAFMMAALPTTAERGKPPARLFASVMMSGSTPLYSMAKVLPVRQKPLWISSQMSRMPCWSQILRSACRKLGEAT